jgi:branched-chain amino acid transport system permease protein
MTKAAILSPVNKRFIKACSGTALVVPLLVGLPHILSPYWQSVSVLFAINVTLVLGYRLITTMGGWSFAHVSTMGLGAYTMAILTTLENPWSFWITFFLGPLVAGVFALLIAYPVLRTRHYYFFLSTFAAGEALRQCYVQFSGITGGTYGIAFVPRPESILGIDFKTTTGFYYLAMALAVCTGLALYRFELSRYGATIKAVAANEELSESNGINTWAYRTLPFVLGSVVAGFAGVLYGNFNGIIGPSDFTAYLMFKLVAAAIVGGVVTFYGPVLGLLFLTALEEIFRDYTDWVPLFWGFSVILALLFTRGGLESVVPGIAARVRSVRAERDGGQSGQKLEES